MEHERPISCTKILDVSEADLNDIIMSLQEIKLIFLTGEEARASLRENIGSNFYSLTLFIYILLIVNI